MAGRFKTNGELCMLKDEAAIRDETNFFRNAVEHLDDKAKADLKVALYGSSFFLALSLVPYGNLPHASLLCRPSIFGIS
jgi:hypothetical protein